MALSSTVLSAAIRAAILAKPNIGAIDGQALTDLCDAIAGAVIAHVQSAAVVNTVTTCPAGAGAGVGGVS